MKISSYHHDISIFHCKNLDFSLWKILTSYNENVELASRKSRAVIIIKSRLLAKIAFHKFSINISINIQKAKSVLHYSQGFIIFCNIWTSLPLKRFKGNYLNVENCFQTIFKILKCNVRQLCQNIVALLNVTSPHTK